MESDYIITALADDGRTDRWVRDYAEDLAATLTMISNLGCWSEIHVTMIGQIQPWFPTLAEYAEMVAACGWDEPHNRMCELFGFKAADALDQRYVNYVRRMGVEL